MSLILERVAQYEKVRGFNEICKESFVIPFRGGEIWIEHLDGMQDCEMLVQEKIIKDKMIFSRPSMPALICINLDETTITENIYLAIIDTLINTVKEFRKVCFVGEDKKYIRLLKKSLVKNGFLVHFEKAKEWLIPKKYR